MATTAGWLKRQDKSPARRKERSVYGLLRTVTRVMLFDLIFSDAQMYNRVRTLLKERGKEAT